MGTREPYEPLRLGGHEGENGCFSPKEVLNGGCHGSYHLQPQQRGRGVGSREVHAPGQGEPEDFLTLGKDRGQAAWGKAGPAAPTKAESTSEVSSGSNKQATAHESQLCEQSGRSSLQAESEPGGPLSPCAALQAGQVRHTKGY